MGVGQIRFIISLAVLRRSSRRFRRRRLLDKLPERSSTCPTRLLAGAGPARLDIRFLSSWLRWLLLASLALLVVAGELALRANLATPPHMPRFILWC